MQTMTDLIQLAEQYERDLPPLRLPLGHPGARPTAAWVDHTLLKPEATPQQVETLCREAVQYAFAAVCVNPIYVPQVRKWIDGSGVKACTVVGFPLGATLSAAKADETRRALAVGAQEIDMVLPIGLLRAGEYQAVLEDIAQVVEVSHQVGALVKVIFETALLNTHEKIMACLLCQQAGAEFVKTSTGFSTGGATKEDVELMRRVVGPEMGVKAAGGIRSLADAQIMLGAGATRLGTSAGVKIAAEWAASGGAA